MKRSISKVTPFAFDSTFRTPEPKRAAIELSVAELRALLAETRTSTAELVRNDTLAAEADRLSRVSSELKVALKAVVDLSAHLEAAGLSEAERQSAMDSVRHIARTLIDGQSDLFEES